MKFKFIGVGAAGDKAVINLSTKAVCDDSDILLINSTDVDIPSDIQSKVMLITKNNTGCGKERSIAKEYAVEFLKTGALDEEIPDDVDSVMIATSVEGGTGSGATPVIAQYVSKVLGKNVHICAFYGFNDDVRGMMNTVSFFKELDQSMDVMIIRNDSFLSLAKNNKLGAERLANDEFAYRCRVLMGKDLIASSQNIDSTDIYKVVTTPGYKTVDHIEFENSLESEDQFNSLCKKMMNTTKSVRGKNPGVLRLAVVLNIKPESEDAVDYTFLEIKNVYGTPFECFQHIQWNGKKQYIQIIASGMKMPIDELRNSYNAYLDATKKVDKTNDDFYDELGAMKADENDSVFDIVRKTGSVEKKDSFFDNL